MLYGKRSRPCLRLGQVTAVNHESAKVGKIYGRKLSQLR